jgi:hypothetical protein
MHELPFWAIDDAQPKVAAGARQAAGLRAAEVYGDVCAFLDQALNLQAAACDAIIVGKPPQPSHANGAAGPGERAVPGRPRWPALARSVPQSQ